VREVEVLLSFFYLPINALSHRARTFYKDDQETKDYFFIIMHWATIVGILIVIFLVVGGLSLYKSLAGPLFDMLKDIFGVVDSASKILEAELQKCQQSYNPFKGCLLTLIPAVLGSFYVLKELFKAVTSGRKTAPGQSSGEDGDFGRYMQAEMGSDALTVKDITDANKAMEEVKAKGGSEAAQKLAGREVVKRSGMARLKLKLGASPGPDQRSQYNKILADSNKASEDEKKNLTDEDRTAIDESDIPPPPEPFD